MGANPEGTNEGGGGPATGNDTGVPEAQSFDFERTTPVDVQPQRSAPPRPVEFTPPAPVAAPVSAPVAPAVAAVSAPTPAPVAPPAVQEPRPEWTPVPPSDATREGPRSEP